SHEAAILTQALGVHGRAPLCDRFRLPALPRRLLALEDPADPSELGAGALGDAALPQPFVIDRLVPDLDFEPAVPGLAVAALAALVHGPLPVLLDEPAHRAILLPLGPAQRRALEEPQPPAWRAGNHRRLLVGRSCRRARHCTLPPHF